MNVTLYAPQRESCTYQDAMSQLVDRSLVPRKSDRQIPLDVIETADDIIVKASLPGCNRDDIEISFREGRLTIRATAQSTSTGDNQRLLLNERRGGEVSRTLAVNIAVDADRANAGFNDGVLTLTLPKAVQAKSHRIPLS